MEYSQDSGQGLTRGNQVGPISLKRQNRWYHITSFVSLFPMEDFKKNGRSKYTLIDFWDVNNKSFAFGSSAIVISQFEHCSQ